MTSDFEKKIIQATEKGLPLDLDPYGKLAEQLETSRENVLDAVSKMLESKMIRRIAAVPNHYKMGYTANGMTVWDVNDAVVDSLGARVGALDFVTHCYRRPRHMPTWPYNLFAMVHAKTRLEVEEKAKKIREILGEACQANDILYSSRILKKTGFRGMN